MANNNSQLLDIQQSAAFLGVSASTIRRWARNRTLTALKVGSRGDWRFTEPELLKLLQLNTEKEQKRKVEKVKKVLSNNAYDIQKIATKQHKKYLGNSNLTNEFTKKYVEKHIEIVKAFVKNLDDIDKGMPVFKKLGRNIAQDAVEDDLTLEEAIDGTIFLKQAVWHKLKEEGLLNELTTENFYRISELIGTYADVLASTVAFTYYEDYKKTLKKDIVIQQQAENVLRDARKFAEDIIKTIREPFVVLDNKLRVVSANKSFYATFNVSQKTTKGKLIYHLGNGQWDIPKLRVLLEEVLPKNKQFNNFEVQHNFPSIGQKFMLVNARQIEKMQLILFAIEDLTQHKRQEEESSKLGAIVNSSEDAIVSKSLDSIITSWNKAAENLFQYKADETIGKHISIIIPKELQYEEENIIKNIKHGKPVEHFETERLRKDGTRINVSLSISPIKDSRGTIIGASKIARDITNHKKLERILQQQARLLDLSYDAIFIWDFNGAITYWNKAAQDLYGYTKEEAIGKVSHTLLHTLHPKGFNAFKKEINRNKKWEGELIHITKSGQIITIESKQILIKDIDGKNIVLETNRDITNRKQTERNIMFLSEASKILSSSLDFKTTLNNVAKLAVPKFADWCGIELLQEDGTLKQVAIAHKNPKMVKWAKEFRKSRPLDMNASSGVPNVIRTGKTEYTPHITDAVLVAAIKDKKDLALARKLNFTSAVTVPLKTSKTIIGAISFVTTESKRLITKADVAIVEELASRAGLAIENAALFQEAQKAISLRDDFISLASHELKTPITSLKMYALALARQYEKNEEKNLSSYFAKMNEQTNKLARLVNDLLNTSKIQHGKLDFDIEKIDLNKVVKDTVDTVQETTNKYIIQIEGSIKKPVYADQYRLYQVLTNLLTNAIKYSPKANKIIVRLTSEKDVAVVTVQDFGIGIEPDQQNKIFNQFYRVTNPEEKTFPGLGMGLFIANEIVKRHGGTMNVVSSKGKGSQFSFAIPYTVQPNRIERTKNNFF